MTRLIPLVLILAGCSGAPVTPKVAEAIAVAECQLDAVKALVPHVATAEAVVNAARVGDIDRAVALMVQLGMSEAQIRSVAEAFVACAHPEGPDAAMPATIGS